MKDAVEVQTTSRRRLLAALLPSVAMGATAGYWIGGEIISSIAVDKNHPQPLLTGSQRQTLQSLTWMPTTAGLISLIASFVENEDDKKMADEMIAEPNRRQTLFRLASAALISFGMGVGNSPPSPQPTKKSRK